MLQQLTQRCHSIYPLQQTMLSYISIITKKSVQQPSQQLNRECMETWKQLQNSKCFWNNMYMLMAANDISIECRIQALVLIQIKIKWQWMAIEENIKCQVRQFVTQELVNLPAECGPSSKIYYSKICSIISSMFTHEYNTHLSQLIPQSCHHILSSMNPIGYLTLLLDIVQQWLPYPPESAAMERLTSQQYKQLQDKIMGSYPSIQKCLQKYIQIDSTEEVLRLCFQTVKHIGTWVSPYDMAIGQVIEKTMLIASANQHQSLNTIRVQAVRCLLTIAQKSTKSCEQCSLPKLHKKKLQILLKLLQIQKSATQKQKIQIFGQKMVAEILSCALTVLKQHQQDSIRYSIYVRSQANKDESSSGLLMGEAQTRQQYESVLHMISRLVLAYENSRMEDCSTMSSMMHRKQDMLGIYEILSSFLYKQEGINKVLTNIIRLAVCPYSTQFYPQCGINSESTNVQRQKYTSIMSSVVSMEQEQYDVAILNIIDDNYFRHQINQQCQFMAQLIWSIYYFIHVSINDNLKTIIFTIVNRLIKLQAKLHSLITNYNKSAATSTSIPPQQLLRMSMLIKPGILLLLSHPKCVQQNKAMLYNPFILYLATALSESSSLLTSAVLDIMQLCYNDIGWEDKYKLHVCYMKNRSVANNRDESKYTNIVARDAKYVGLLAKTHTSKHQQAQFIMRSILEIPNIYKQQILNCNTYKINPNNALEVQHHSQSLSARAHAYTQTLLPALPHLPVLCLRTLPDFQQVHPILTPLSLSLSKSYLQHVPSQLTREQVDMMLAHCLPIVALLLNKYPNGDIHVRDALAYFGVVIDRVVGWDIQASKLANIIEGILKKVYGVWNGYQVEGYSQFLQSVIKCIKCTNISSELVETTLMQILHKSCTVSQKSSQQHLHLLQILVSQPSSCQAINKFILDLLSNTFHKFIQNRNPVLLPQYSTLLYQMLRKVEATQCKGWPHKLLGNQMSMQVGLQKIGSQEIIKILGMVIDGVCPSLEQVFKLKLRDFLGYLIGIQDAVLFQKKLYDFVVVLRRGY